jgi:ornithine cyclodeaminase/alanine dehydrogenase-like protein (mu-crystallin family)
VFTKNLIYDDKSTVQLGQMSAAQRLDEVFGLPRGSEVIALNDPETKVPIAIMDGTLISAIRTGAVTGVCAKYMAPSRSKTVGLFGAGPQCKTQLMALKASLPQLEKAYVYDLSRERAEKFAAEMSQKLNMDVQAASDRLATIESGDILVTATTATEPIIHGAEIKKGVYVAHLGNNEVDEELILRGQGRHRRLGDR